MSQNIHFLTEQFQKLDQKESELSHAFKKTKRKTKLSNRHRFYEAFDPNDIDPEIEIELDEGELLQGIKMSSFAFAKEKQNLALRPKSSKKFMKFYHSVPSEVNFSNSLKYRKSEEEKVRSEHLIKQNVRLRKSARGMPTEYGDLNRLQTKKSLLTRPTVSQGGKLKLTNFDGVIRSKPKHLDFFRNLMTPRQNTYGMDKEDQDMHLDLRVTKHNVRLSLDQADYIQQSARSLRESAKDSSRSGGSFDEVILNNVYISQIDKKKVRKAYKHGKIFDQLVEMNSSVHDSITNDVSHRSKEVKGEMKKLIKHEDSSSKLRRSSILRSTSSASVFDKVYAFRMKLIQPNDIRHMWIHICFTDLTSNKSHKLYNLHVNRKNFVEFNSENLFYPSDKFPWISSSDDLRGRRVKILVKGGISELVSADNVYDDDEANVFHDNFLGPIVKLSEDHIEFTSRYFASGPEVPITIRMRTDEIKHSRRRKQQTLRNSIPIELHRKQSKLVKFDQKKFYDLSFSPFTNHSPYNPHTKKTEKRLPHTPLKSVRNQQEILYHINPYDRIGIQKSDLLPESRKKSANIPKKPQTAPTKRRKSKHVKHARKRASMPSRVKGLDISILRPIPVHVIRNSIEKNQKNFTNDFMESESVD